ncbi:helix-turn-helix domain-containing protein [Amycolatopsis sp. NPDC049252]|uniref:helix-turn-helix domain-containing protein n=1 Tax=Amycolatopsis sp. NPDC049252 TaxID=3363933 RepID=UPI00371476C3
MPTRNAAHTAPSLGALLRQARVARGMSLRAAAEGTGISYSSLARIESGERSAPLEGLLELGRRLGLPQATVMQVAGVLSQDGMRDLIGSHLRGVIRGGRISPEATAALRRVHLARLLEPLGSELVGRPVDVWRLAATVELRAVEGPGLPGFDASGNYRVPPQANPNERVTQRAWLAHGIGHAMLGREDDVPPACDPLSTAREVEREATRLAMLILLPPAPLRARLRESPLGPLTEGEDIAAVIEEIASDFDAPATFAATRLADEGALAVLPVMV